MTHRRAALQAEELRRVFDAGFAAAPEPDGMLGEQVLTVRVGAERFAVGLADLTAIVSDRPVVQLPTAVAALLGLCTFRGELVPVYSLAALLGRAAPGGSDRPGTLLLVRPASPVGLAVDRVLGLTRVERASLAPHTGGAGDPGMVHGVAHIDGAACGVLDIAALLTAVPGRADAARSEGRERR